MNLPPRRHPPIFGYVVVAALIGLGFRVPIASAANPTTRANELKVGESQTIKLFDGKFNNGATVASAEVSGDHTDDYIVGAGETGGPKVEIYNQAGGKIAEWFAYDGSVKTGIYVAAGDLTGDGHGEIVVGPQPGYKPEVRVFDVHGKLLGSFNAFESSYTGGVHVAVMPYHDGTPGSIVVGTGVGRQPEVRVYSWPAKQVTATWLPFGQSFGNGIPVAAMWSDIFSQPVIVIGNGAGYSPKVQVYGLTSASVVASWYAFDQGLRTGVNVGASDDSVVAATGPLGGPEVRTFSITGGQMIGYFAFEKDFRGGVQVGLTHLNGILTPIAVPTAQPTSAAGTGKRIVVNLKQQELRQYVFGHLIGVHKISSGKWSTPTPTGNFVTHNKIPVAYSKPYGLYMEWWMAFTADGKNGLHGLPFWKLKGGGKLYEGAKHIGIPVSHGCIRQTVAEAKALYDWTPIGTPVIVEKG